jgi:hypothetical protein
VTKRQVTRVWIKGRDAVGRGGFDAYHAQRGELAGWNSVERRRGAWRAGTMSASSSFTHTILCLVMAQPDSSDEMTRPKGLWLLKALHQEMECLVVDHIPRTWVQRNVERTAEGGQKLVQAAFTAFEVQQGRSAKRLNLPISRSRRPSLRKMFIVITLGEHQSRTKGLAGGGGRGRHVPFRKSPTQCYRITREDTSNKESERWSFLSWFDAIRLNLSPSEIRRKCSPSGRNVTCSCNIRGFYVG